MSLPHGGRFPWNISWRFVKMGRSTTLHSNIHRCSKARGREALQCALGLNAKTLHVFSDSEVIVKQMSGGYSCRSPRLYSLNWICRKLARSLDFSISHVPRESNTEANSLASSAARNAE